MKKIIWLEILLMGASILIFRSVWTLLDKNGWASSELGLMVLLVLGTLAAVVALCGIEALLGQKRTIAEKE